MPRLTISLPDELRVRSNGAGAGSETTSRRLGAGIEGADEWSQHFDRWLCCWATSDD